MLQIQMESAKTIHWQVHSPNHTARQSEADYPLWMTDLHRFRWRMLFGESEGHGTSTPSPRADIDAFDMQCHHLLAYCRNTLVGCVRLSPILTRVEILGYLNTLEIQDLDPQALASLEKPTTCGRWIVDPAFRASGLGNRLAAGAFAFARSLGSTDILAVVGTALGQDRILMRTGAKSFAGTGTIHSHRFNQAVRLLHFDPWKVPGTFFGLLSQMEAELNLPQANMEQQDLQAA